MRYLTKILGITTLVSLLSLGSLSSPARGDTGSAITGDTGTGNQDSSTFTGGNFDAPGVGGSVILGGQNSERALPRNWSCHLPYKNEEGSLRFKTVATMLSTNLAGTDSLNLLQGQGASTGADGQPTASSQGPVFSCAQRMAIAPSPVSSRPNNESSPISSGNLPNQPLGSGAALLGEIRPNTNVLMAAAPDNVVPASPQSVSLVRYFNTPAETGFPFLGKNIEDSLLTDLSLPALSSQEMSAPLPNDLDFTSASPETKSKMLRDLLTSLQGLTTQKNLLDDPQGESLMNIDQFVAVVKNYNDLISALNYNELQAWTNNRYGQDITSSIKTLRTVCNCGWSAPPSSN